MSVKTAQAGRSIHSRVLFDLNSMSEWTAAQRGFIYYSAGISRTRRLEDTMGPRTNDRRSVIGVNPG
jgi:hypothetical protein